jgi:uncharacterized protein with HEPN domain
MNEHNIICVKNEYLEIFCHKVSQQFCDGIMSIYKYAHDNDNKLIKIGEQILQLNFDDLLMLLLKDIPNWNDGIVNDEVTRLFSNTFGERWLTDLLSAVIKCYIRTLTNKHDVDDIAYDANMNKFVHHCYKEIGEYLQKYHKHIFKHDGVNYMRLLSIIRKCIVHSIFDNIPIEQVLKSFSDKLPDLEHTPLTQHTHHNHHTHRAHNTHHTHHAHNTHITPHVIQHKRIRDEHTETKTEGSISQNTNSFASNNLHQYEQTPNRYPHISEKINTLFSNHNDDAFSNRQSMHHRGHSYGNADTKKFIADKSDIAQLPLHALTGGENNMDNYFNNLL